MNRAALAKRQFRGGRVVGRGAVTQWVVGGFILVLLRNGGLINNLKLWQEEQSVEKLECSPTYYHDFPTLELTLVLLCLIYHNPLAHPSDIQAWISLCNLIHTLHTLVHPNTHT